MLLQRHKTILMIIIPVILFISGIGVADTHAQVYVGGTITESTTWEKSKSPYIVIENIRIPQNISLTIEAGVTVIVRENRLIKVEGDIIARGTQQDSIYFQNESGIWYGLSLNNVHTITDDGNNYLSGTCLSHVSIKNTYYAVTLENNSSILIDSSSFYQSSYGLYMYYTNNNLLRANQFIDCDFAICSASNYSSSFNRFLNNKIINSKHVGIFFNNSSGQSLYNTFLGNEISGNFIGIHLGNPGPHENSHSVIRQNKITNNIYGVRIYKDSTDFDYNRVSSNLFGIELNNARFCNIQYNIISDNRLWAVSFMGESSYNNIIKNTIKENVRGMRFVESNDSKSQFNTVLYNSLIHNSDSVVFNSSSSQLVFHYNNIYDNGDSCTFINATSDTVHAEFNYWGTDDTTAINRIIFDIYDDAAQEIVLYKPFETNANTDTPINPPKEVYKKMDGDMVFVNWARNSEADLAGYKVYYGNGLEQIINSGNDTLVIIPGINLIDTVAVTAYDTQADGNDDVFEGHESDFTYAQIIPFAGKDTTICVGQQLYLGEATAFNYTKLLWFTTGDGVFSDAAILHPYYSPGVNDLLIGSVTLTIAIKGDGFDLKDDITLNFRPLPYIFAGNDTTLFINSVIQFNDAQAKNVSSLKWETSGDGFFDTNTDLFSVYHPGINDSINGIAELVLHGHSECGDVLDTVRVSFIPVFNISGRVISDRGLISEARISLINTAEADIKAVKEVISEQAGTFTFNYLPAGTYSLKAYPAQYSRDEFLPVYFYNELLWQNANNIQLHENTYDVDIYLPAFQPLPPAGICRLRGICKIEPDGGLCSDVDVFLYDRNLQHILNWQTVSEDGSFFFDNMPYGRYVIMAQKIGYSGIPSEVLSLTEQNPDASELEIWLTSDKKLFFKNIPSGQTHQVSLSPNPTQGIINLTTETDINERSVILYNSVGCKQDPAKIIFQRNETGYLFDFSYLATGFYLLKFSIGNTEYSSKILIQR